MSQRRPYFIHIRPANFQTNPKGGITIAIGGSPEHGFCYAKAQCHSKDNYNKATGRAKAAGRLNSVKHAVPISQCASITEAEALLRNTYRQD